MTKEEIAKMREKYSSPIPLSKSPILVDIHRLLDEIEKLQRENSKLAGIHNHPLYGHSKRDQFKGKGTSDHLEYVVWGDV